MGPGVEQLESSSRRAAPMRPEDRRSMIVAAALPLLLEHGEMVKTRDIATAAGIAEGTIFRAFPTKDDLIRAVIDAALDTAALDAALAAIPLDLSLEERVTAAVVVLQQRVVDVWRLFSAVGVRFADRTGRPIDDSAPLARLFAADKDALRVKPAAAARALRAYTLAVSHPLLADMPMRAGDLARQFLFGVVQEHRPC